MDQALKLEPTWFAWTAAWLLSLPVFLAVLIFAINNALARREGIPWGATVWITFCFLLLSPFRYMVFQAILSLSYPWQSWRAFLSSMILVLYAPFLFALLYGVCLVLPYYVAGQIIRKTEKLGWTRWIGYILVPLICMAGSAVFFRVLPRVGTVTHWVKAQDVLPAASGPAYVTYRFFLYGLRPPLPRYVVHPSGNPRLRVSLERAVQSHVAAVYLGKKEHQRFYEAVVKEIAPEPPGLRPGSDPRVSTFDIR